MAELTESEFERLAGALLEHMAQSLEEALGDDAEVDLEGGILTIALETGGRYVINKHTPNRQIWVSSPKSGASHYGFDAAQEGWRDTRSGRSLEDALAGDLGVSSQRLLAAG